MARPKKTIPTVYHTVGLPLDLSTKLELHLYSELEGKIPLGDKAEFFTKLVRDFFDKQERADVGAGGV